MTVTADLNQSFLFYWHSLAGDSWQKLEPILEYQFTEKRKWRLDIAFPAERVGIELDGGGYGRVVRCTNCHAVMRSESGSVLRMPHPSHYSLDQRERDYEKQNYLLLLGWRLLRYSSRQLNGSPLMVITQVKMVLLDSINKSK